jgi:peptide-methionine (S)-S-oxide reductase
MIWSTQQCKLTMQPKASTLSRMNQSIVLAGGCFWCTEALYTGIKGVQSVVVGYANGDTGTAPSYEQVCTGRTGFVECCRVTFDPEVVSLSELLLLFFASHDPTTLNQQGADRGTQYRSAILYENPTDIITIQTTLVTARTDLWPGKPIVTQVEHLTHFFEAEDYHQHYFEKNPTAGYCQIVINPKLAKVKAAFATLYREG